MTPGADALRLTKWLRGFCRSSLGGLEPSHVLEPTAGAGAFVEAALATFPRTEVTAFDLEPLHPLVRKADFFETEVMSEHHRLTTIAIGNPPFQDAEKSVCLTGSKRNCPGGSNTASRTLINRILEHAGRSAAVLAFLVPRGFLRVSYMSRLPPCFRMVHAEPQEIEFAGTGVQTSFVVLVDERMLAGRGVVFHSPPLPPTPSHGWAFRLVADPDEANVVVRGYGLSIRGTGGQNIDVAPGSEMFQRARERVASQRDVHDFYFFIRAENPGRLIERFRSRNVVDFVRKISNSRTRLTLKLNNLESFLRGDETPFDRFLFRIINNMPPQPMSV